MPVGNHSVSGGHCLWDFQEEDRGLFRCVRECGRFGSSGFGIFSRSAFSFRSLKIRRRWGIRHLFDGERQCVDSLFHESGWARGTTSFSESVFPRNGRRIGKQPLGSTCCVFLRCGRKRIQYGLVITISRCYYANKRWISRFQKTYASLETPVQYGIVAMATKFTSLWDQPPSGNAKLPLWRGRPLLGAFQNGQGRNGVTMSFCGQRDRGTV